MEDWTKTSKYYVPWERYVEMHPEIDERNLAAMKDRYIELQEKVFNQVMGFLL